MHLKAFLLLFFTTITFHVYSGATPWIEFELTNGHIKIPFKINGVETHAILDSGATVHAINKAFVNKHELDLDQAGDTLISGVYGTERKTTYNNVPTEFFGFTAELDNIPEVRLGHHDVGFLLGAPFFSNFVIQIDYPNKKMRLISKDAVRVADFDNITMRKQKGSGAPIVRVGLPNDESAWLLFDTGNTGGIVIERHLAQNLGWLDDVNTETGMGAGVNEVVSSESFRLPYIQFGPYELENVLVNVPNKGDTNLESRFEATGTNLKGQKVRGLIGYDVLKHFVVTFDYSMGRAHIGLPQ